MHTKAKLSKIILQNNAELGVSSPRESLPNCQMLNTWWQQELLWANYAKDNLSQTNPFNIYIHEVAPDHQPAITFYNHSPYGDGGFTRSVHMIQFYMQNHTWCYCLMFPSFSSARHTRNHRRQDLLCLSRNSTYIMRQADFMHATTISKGSRTHWILYKKELFHRSACTVMSWPNTFEVETHIRKIFAHLLQVTLDR